MDKRALEEALAAFTSPLAALRHWTRSFHYTEGVKFLAEHAGAHWLLDYIAARQKLARKDRRLRDLQRWVIKKTDTRYVRIACCRESSEKVFHEDVQLLGEFPLEEITLYLESETLMLPSERRS